MSALVDPTTGEVVPDCTPDEARQLIEQELRGDAAVKREVAS